MPCEVGVILGQLQAALELDQRQRVGRVAVDLVRRAEHERRAVGVASRRLQQVERAERVDLEVGVRVGRGPVVRRLRGRVDHELDPSGVLGEHALHGVAVADVDGQRREAVGKARQQRLGHVRSRRLRAEEARAHVVLQADHIEARAAAKRATDSEPISPPEPVTIAVGIGASRYRRGTVDCARQRGSRAVVDEGQLVLQLAQQRRSGVALGDRQLRLGQRPREMPTSGSFQAMPRSSAGS